MFIDGLLTRMSPFPAANSVIVMDNCRIHKGPEIAEMIEARYSTIYVSAPAQLTIVLDRGMRLEFLPPYSPDYNPIELAFSVIKARFKRHHGDFARSNTTGTNGIDRWEVYIMLLNLVYSITAEEARGFFHHSGYL